jgi:pilus assembly protein FimV
VKLSAADVASSENGISFDAFSPPTGLGAEISTKAPVVVVSPPPPAEAGLNFDLSGLNLDLDKGGESGGSDEFDTKFELAEECRKLGDKESARQILKEVLAAASGSVKSRAQRLFDELA